MSIINHIHHYEKRSSSFIPKLLIIGGLFSTILASSAHGLVIATKDADGTEINVFLNGILDVPLVFSNPDKKIEIKDLNVSKANDYENPTLASFASLTVGVDAENEHVKGGATIGVQTTNFSQRAVSTCFYFKNKGPHFVELRLGSETAMGLKLQADSGIYNGKLVPLQNFLPSNSGAHTWDGGPFLGSRDRPSSEKPRMVSVMLSAKLGEMARVTFGGSYIPESANVGSKSHNDLEFKNHPLVKDLKMSITNAYSLGANLEMDFSSVKFKVGAMYEVGTVNLFVQNYEIDKLNPGYILNNARNAADVPQDVLITSPGHKKEGNLVRLPSEKYKVNNYQSFGFSAAIYNEYFGIGGSYQTMGDSFLIPNLNTSGDKNVKTKDNEEFLKLGSNSNSFYTFSFGGYLDYNNFRVSLKYDKTSNTYNNTFDLTELAVTYKAADFFTTYARVGFYNTKASYKVSLRSEDISNRLTNRLIAGNIPPAVAGNNIPVVAGNIPAGAPAIDPSNVQLDLRAFDQVKNPDGIVDFKKLSTPVDAKGTIVAIGAIMVF